MCLLPTYIYILAQILLNVANLQTSNFQLKMSKSALIKDWEMVSSDLTEPFPLSSVPFVLGQDNLAVVILKGRPWFMM